MIRRGVDFLFKVVEIIAIILTGAMLVDVSLQILFRYVVGRSLFWTEEVGRYTLIWIIFLGANIALRRKKHIGIDFVVSHLNPQLQKLSMWLVKLLILLFAIVLIFYGIELYSVTMMQTSAALHIPMGYVYMAIPVCGVLMILDLVSER